MFTHYLYGTCIFHICITPLFGVIKYFHMSCTADRTGHIETSNLREWQKSLGVVDRNRGHCTAETKKSDLHLKDYDTSMEQKQTQLVRVRQEYARA